ncbi:hypothetical protein V5799_004387 [Amblyomma americanum]|uniref:Ran gtpase-activating protein n=1 Tax=Amblyomma americanum TaxID=6943 RepID=A0AAQ4D693_AMBAM
MALTTDHWKGQLNFRRICTFAGPLDRCGLLSELPSWNRVLYSLEYELAETCPGKLSLRYVPHDPMDKCAVSAASKPAQAAFLISWLLEHHGCIDELSVSSSLSAPQANIPVRLRRPLVGTAIRSLEVTLCTFYSGACYLVEQDVDALRGIEQLRIRDGTATDESRLVSLLRNNSHSLTFVQLSHTLLSQHMLDALQRLEKCESVTLSDCTSDDDTFSESNALTAMLRSMAALKTLTFSSDRDAEWNFSAISAALKANVTLTALDLAVDAVDETSSPKELFAALEENHSVRTLRVKVGAIDASCGTALASALRRNSCLVNLHLAGNVDDHCLILMAEALSQNTTLENLDVRNAEFGASGVWALCDAINTNKTLKKLVLPEFSVPKEYRPALAEKLAQADGYRRVLQPFLDEYDLQALSTRLACPTTCPEEITDIDFCSLSDATMKLFFDALSSSSCVQAFTVSIEENCRVNVLCEMLVANRSISSVHITIEMDDGMIVQQLLNAIEGNKKISKLAISICSAEIGAASAVSDFISRNRTVTTLTLCIGEHRQYRVVEQISRGMKINPIIVELGGGPWCDMSYAIFAALQRNRVALNRAADFALGRRESRCAEAFQLFSRTPCLVALVMKTSGRNEREALQAIAWAERFL